MFLPCPSSKYQSSLQMLPGSTDRPSFPLNLLADFAGGGMACALGILLALFERNASGRGQIVNADMVSERLYLARVSPFLISPLGFWCTICFVVSVASSYETIDRNLCWTTRYQSSRRRCTILQHLSVQRRRLHVSRVFRTTILQGFH